MRGVIASGKRRALSTSLPEGRFGRSFRVANIANA